MAGVAGLQIRYAPTKVLTRGYVSFGEDDDDVNDEILKTMRKAKKFPASKQIRGRFVSPWPNKKSLWDVAKLLMSPKPPRLQLPNVTDSISLIHQLQVDMDAIRNTSCPHVTWMGHASCYYQTDGVYFLTDPVWSDRASPLSFAGPKRYTKTPVDVANIKVDIVLLSHTHYDHMDVPTIRTIGNRALW
jgi:N-acyl-phosphatidylethanolamine-hydrolysing phospholipase D